MSIGNSTASCNGRRLTVAALAEAKRLPLNFLRDQLGLNDLADGAGVAIPYYDRSGEEPIASKQRTALNAKDGSYWPAGQRLQAYGQWRLDEAQRHGFLILVEGESDCWALWLHGLPALGIPGANAVKTLEQEHLEAIKTLYVHREPDKGGETFVNGIRGRLAALGFQGRAFELHMPAAVKDPADLHVQNPEQFRLRVQSAIEAAVRIDARPAAALKFATPLKASELQSSAEGTPWVWHGYLVRGHVTMLSAFWKCGKTTLLTHLLRALAAGDKFCGHQVVPGSALYVTEESEQRWAERRDKLGLGDHCRFQIRPFKFKPRFGDWLEFLAHLRGELTRQPADLLVFDTLSKLWPVRNENDAAEVDEALMPLYQLTDACPCAIALGHHVRKSGGQEGTASRGSGALGAFVDIISELWRFDPDDDTSRRRVLKAFSRWDETPHEMVLDLAPDGMSYKAEGTKAEVGANDIAQPIECLLPGKPPGWTADEIRDRWPAAEKPSERSIREELHNGAASGRWHRVGTGKKGDGFRYWREPKQGENGNENGT
jgi:hypothetical protein